MYQWTKDSIRFRIDAAETTKFDDTIIAQIVSEIPQMRMSATRAAGSGIRALRWRGTARG
jgi:hypothetical protein